MNPLLRRIALLSGWVILLVPTLFLARHPAPAVAATGKGHHGRHTMLLIAPEGKVDLRSEPCGPTARLTKPAGTLVRVGAQLAACGGTWVLVELVDGSGMGWVPAAALIEPGATGPSFGHFIFVSGRRAAPILFAPPLLDSEAIWLRFDFAGLRPGDVVQWVLDINGERYAFAPVIWGAAGKGQQWVNLMSVSPRPVPAVWLVIFYVNDEYVAQASLPLR